MSAVSPSGRLTLLVHGLAETPLIFAPLDIALRQAGSAVDFITYPSTLEPPEALVSRYIVPGLARHGDVSRLDIVTHSLGGILVHAALQRMRPANLGRVVMTAPGFCGSEALEVYRHNPVHRLLYGPAGYYSGTGPDGFASGQPKAADYELGVVAGSLSSDPIANLFVPWPHDGKISVPRTRIDGMADHIVLPLPHDFLCNAPAAVLQIMSFLREGRFQGGERLPANASTTFTAKPDPQVSDLQRRLQGVAS